MTQGEGDTSGLLPIGVKPKDVRRSAFRVFVAATAWEYAEPGTEERLAHWHALVGRVRELRHAVGDLNDEGEAT